MDARYQPILPKQYSMKWLITAATQAEIHPLLQHFNPQAGHKGNFSIFRSPEFQVDIYITGVGIPLTAMNLSRFLSQNSYQHLFNVGIAGSFSPAYPIGTVVEVNQEQFGDLGIEMADGQFRTVFDSGLIEPDSIPFENGRLFQPIPYPFTHELPKVSGITVNKVHGYPPNIEAVRKKFRPDIESMEGAAFFLTCLEFQQAFTAIRSISNRVEARDRSKWDIPLAIKNLNAFLIQLVEKQSQP
jgi:futalosine hydrolase